MRGGAADRSVVVRRPTRPRRWLTAGLLLLASSTPTAARADDSTGELVTIGGEALLAWYCVLWVVTGVVLVVLGIKRRRAPAWQAGAALLGAALVVGGLALQYGRSERAHERAALNGPHCPPRLDLIFSSLHEAAAEEPIVIGDPTRIWPEELAPQAARLAARLATVVATMVWFSNPSQDGTFDVGSSGEGEVRWFFEGGDTSVVVSARAGSLRARSLSPCGNDARATFTPAPPACTYAVARKYALAHHRRAPPAWQLFGRPTAGESRWQVDPRHPDYRTGKPVYLGTFKLDGLECEQIATGVIPPWH